MQLNISTDYAIRAMLFLSTVPLRANAADIASSMNIPLNTCKKNLQLLKNAGLLNTYAGMQGGYTLSRSASEITVRDILNAVGEKTNINRCLEDDCFCNRHAVDSCSVRKLYSNIQISLDKIFSASLADLASGNFPDKE